MKRIRRASSFAILAVLLAVIGGSPTPAHAAGYDKQYINEYGYVFKCHSDIRWFDLPNKSDIQIGYEVCLGRKGNTLVVDVRLDQVSPYIPWVGSYHKWDGLEATFHLERRWNGASVDHVVKTMSCNIKNEFNVDQNGWDHNCTNAYEDNEREYWWPGVAYDSAYDWSVDGYLDFDIDGDGQGWDLWDFTGSPLHY